jgi:hypothetical protein
MRRAGVIFGCKTKIAGSHKTRGGKIGDTADWLIGEWATVLPIVEVNHPMGKVPSQYLSLVTSFGVVACASHSPSAPGCSVCRAQAIIAVRNENSRVLLTKTWTAQ